MDLQLLADIAIEAAVSAGKIIQNYKNRDVVVEKKEGGFSYASQVVTQVDRECEQVILSHLEPSCKTYDIALLSEETPDDNSRFEKEFFWCIDPIDGTLAFINKEPGFSVSIALVAKDGTPTVGVVYDPNTNTLYHAIKGKGAFKNQKEWKVKNTNNYLTYFTDRKLNDTPKLEEIQQLLESYKNKNQLTAIKEVSGAGAVLNAILVAENGPACFLKLPKKETGGGSIWDYAATACIFKELNLPATNFSGGRLNLNKKSNSFMNDEGICYLNSVNI
jgi:fructose-1,6-bisphosphatase/inositol monophosphatase family enzyme